MTQYSEAAHPAFRDYVRQHDPGALDPPQVLHVVVDGFKFGREGSRYEAAGPATP